ncbi:22386_t:CDS:2, partial [Gigaspora margarita]
MKDCSDKEKFKGFTHMYKKGKPRTKEEKHKTKYHKEQQEQQNLRKIKRKQIPNLKIPLEEEDTQEEAIPNIVNTVKLILILQKTVIHTEQKKRKQVYNAETIDKENNDTGYQEYQEYQEYLKAKQAYL